MRTGSDARKVENFVEDYRAEGLDVELVEQQEIYHYCLLNIASDKIIVKVLAVTGDPTQPVRLADEILVMK